MGLEDITMTVQINDSKTNIPTSCEEAAVVVARGGIAVARAVDSGARYVAPRVVAGTKASLHGFGRGLGWLAGQALKGADRLQQS